MYDTGNGSQDLYACIFFNVFVLSFLEASLTRNKKGYSFFFVFKNCKIYNTIVSYTTCSCELRSHNSDFKSRSCELRSYNSDFITCNSIYNSEF